MKISSRGEYGVRAMLDLALHYGQGPIPLKKIAERQDISEHYLEQLIASLRKAGLVISHRGAQGGYELAATPGETKVSDIIRVLEGPIAPMECVEENPGDCSHTAKCATRVLWKKLQESMEAVLENTTLEWLAQEAHKLKATDDSFMYHI